MLRWLRIRVENLLDGGERVVRRGDRRLRRTRGLKKSQSMVALPQEHVTRITENEEKHTKRTMACEHAIHSPRSLIIYAYQNYLHAYIPHLQKDRRSTANFQGSHRDY